MTPRASLPNYADRARFERIDRRAEHFDPTERIEEIRQEFRAIGHRVESDDIDRDGASDDLRELRRDLAALDEHVDARCLRNDIDFALWNILADSIDAAESEHVADLRDKFEHLRRAIQDGEVSGSDGRDELREILANLGMDERKSSLSLAEEIREFAETVLRGEVSPAFTNKCIRCGDTFTEEKPCCCDHAAACGGLHEDGECMACCSCGLPGNLRWRSERAEVSR